MTSALSAPSENAMAIVVPTMPKSPVEWAREGRIGGFATERGFDALRVALRASGGIADGNDLARLLEDHRLGDFVSLARLIDHDNVFGFECRRAFWIPMFQFDLTDLSLKHGAGQVVAELATVFDGWALAGWFAQSNSGLMDQRPADVLNASPASVIAAARAERLRVGRTAQSTEPSETPCQN